LILAVKLVLNVSRENAFHAPPLKMNIRLGAQRGRFKALVTDDTQLNE